MGVCLRAEARWLVDDNELADAFREEQWQIFFKCSNHADARKVFCVLMNLSRQLINNRIGIRQLVTMRPNFKTNWRRSNLTFCLAVLHEQARSRNIARSTTGIDSAQIAELLEAVVSLEGVQADENNLQAYRLPKEIYLMLQNAMASLSLLAEALFTSIPPSAGRGIFMRIFFDAQTMRNEFGNWKPVTFPKSKSPTSFLNTTSKVTPKNSCQIR